MVIHSASAEVTYNYNMSIIKISDVLNSNFSDYKDLYKSKFFKNINYKKSL